MSDPRIKSVYLWQNGHVMVFGYDGQQLPDYQGPWAEVRERLTAALPPGVTIQSGIWPHPALDADWRRVEAAIGHGGE